MQDVGSTLPADRLVADHMATAVDSMLDQSRRHRPAKANSDTAATWRRTLEVEEWISFNSLIHRRRAELIDRTLQGL